MATLSSLPHLVKPGRSARWLSERPAEDLAAGRGALLELTVPRRCRGGYRPHTTYYAVLPIEGGYSLLKDEDGRWTAHYDIDTTFGPAAEHWACDCPDYSHRKDEPCKHVLGLHSALAHARIAEGRLA